MKRLLAFSTVSHMGIMLIGFGLLERRALAGMGLYLVGHAMMKASLFLCAGIILHRFESVDEIALRGRGRIAPWTAGIFVCSGLGLAGLPPWGTFLGSTLIKEAAMTQGYGWLAGIEYFATILTGAAVLRVAGRVFAGWGPAEPEVPQGAQNIAETPETRGGHTKTLAIMYMPALAMTLLGLLIGSWPGLQTAVDVSAARFQNHAGYAARVLDGTALPLPAPASHRVTLGEVALGMTSTLLAGALALATLFRHALTTKTFGLHIRAVQTGVGVLRQLHNGIIADYVTWLTIGLAAFGALLVYVLRPL